MSLYDLNKMEPEEVTPAYVRKVAVAETMALARIEVRRGAVTRSHTHAGFERRMALQSSQRGRRARAQSDVGDSSGC